MSNESLKDIRCRVLKNLEHEKKLKQTFYDNLNNLLSQSDSNKLIYVSSEQLSTLNIGERVSIENGVEFEKISETKNKMEFFTTMIDGGKFANHFHNWVEVCEVLEGQLIETRKGDRLTVKVYSKGDRAIYDKGEVHSMHVKDYTLLKVTFLKDIV